MVLLQSCVILAQELEEREDTCFADTCIVEPCLVDSTMKWPQTLQYKIDKLLADSELSLLTTSQLGMMVYDLDADSVLYTYNAKQTMRPASTMKVLTAVTALDILGGSYQFKTRFKYAGEVIDSTKTLVGDLFLCGGMDPKIGKDDLRAFAESLRKLGVDTIRGNICSDRSWKERLLQGEGWCWDDDNPVLSSCVYDRKDQMARQFREVLSESGIQLIGDPVERVAPSSAKELCSRSHTIDQILMRMMKESDNLYAESMFYQIGASQSLPATAKKAATVVKSLIRKIGFDPQRYRVADGSGLSLYNYVSAELEVGFLRYAYRNPNIFNHLYPSLPIAGRDGTLSKRMRRSKADGNVHAKTGTVSGISSLAGYATASNGHKLAFSIINQGIMHATNAKTFQNRLCILMCE